jgi:hypothetical protein
MSDHNEQSAQPSTITTTTSASTRQSHRLILRRDTIAVLRVRSDLRTGPCIDPDTACPCGSRHTF